MKKKTRPPTHPGAILKRQYMEPLELSVTELAKALDISRKTISKIINERAAISADMSLRLSRAFNTTPELWLNMQRNYDLWHAAQDSTSWKDVEPISA